MSFAYREMFAPGVLGVIFGICGALIFLYAFIGPYGTKQAFSFSQRLLFCILWGVVGVPIWYTVGTLALYVLRFRSRTQIAFSLVLYVLFIAGVCAPLPFVILDRLFDYDVRRADYIVGNRLGGAALAACITTLVYYIICLRVSRNDLNDLLSTAMIAATDGTNGGADRAATLTTPVRGDAGVVEESPASTTGPAPAAPASVPDAGFFENVPPEVGRDLVYIKVSGHYLQVVTTRGSRVIIRRLTDAVRELAGLGMQTHRSYWVAFAHIRYVVRRDRRFLLNLDGGYEIPVSRTFLPDVRRHVDNMRPTERHAHGTNASRSEGRAE